MCVTAFLRNQDSRAVSTFSSLSIYFFLHRAKILVTGSRRNLQKRYGKTLNPSEIHRKSPEHGGSVVAGNFLDFSGTFCPVSCAFRQELVENHWKKCRKFPARILPPCSGDSRCTPSRTVPYFLAWLGLISYNVVSVESLLDLCP